MNAPETLVADPKPQPQITDPQMDTNRIYEQEHERQQQVSDDQPIQLAQNETPDSYIGGRQLSNPNNAEVSDSEGPTPLSRQVSTRKNLGSNPKSQIVYNKESGITDNSKDSQSHMAALALAERGQPRDLDNWSNGAVDELMNDKGAWDEEARSARGLAQAKISNVSHHIVQAPDGSKVAFPKGTSPETMHTEMTKWWEPHLQRGAQAWDAVRHAASNAAQAIGLPSDMPEWQLHSDEFMRDPIGKTTDVVGAVIGGLAHGVNSIIPSTPENQAVVERAQNEYKQGNALASAVTLTPLIGDNLAKAVKQAQSKDFSGSIGTVVGTAAPFLTDTFKGEAELPITKEAAAQEAYAGAERRAVAPTDQPAYAGSERRGALMSPTQIEGNLKTGKPVTTPFDSTVGAMDTINRDLATRLETTHAPVEKPGVSVEELSDRPEKKILSIKVDGERAGQMSLTPMPELGEGAMEVSTAQLKPDFQGKGHGSAAYQQAIDYAKSKGANALYSDDQVSTKADRVWQSLVNRGIATADTATGRYKIDLSPKSAGNAEGAASDSALFAKAKEALGPTASLSDVAKEAQRLKTEPQFTGNGSFRQAAVRNLDKNQYDPSSGFYGNQVPKALTPDELRTLKLGGELPKKPIEVRHWSKQGIPLTETNPEKFGTGRAGAEKVRANEPGFLPRTYFGMDGYNEPAVQSGLEHKASLNPNEYYDKDADPNGIWKKGYAEGGATGAERAVKEAGFSGYYSPEQQVAASFEKVPVKVSSEAEQITEHRKNGGSTFDAEGKNLAGTDKWSIGERPDLTETVDNLTSANLKAFKEKNARILQDGEHAVGTWKDDNGKTVLDVVRTTGDKAEAEALAKAANQQAMYNLGTGELVNTGGTGEIPKNSAIPTHYSDIRSAIGERSNRSADILKNNRNFQLTDENGKPMNAFFSIDKEGLITGVINNSEKHGLMSRILEEAKKNGDVTGMVWDGNTKLLDKYKSAGFDPSSHAEYDEQKFGKPSQSLRDYWTNKLGWREGDSYPGVTFTHLEKPVTAKDLWTDETGTYTSGQFMKFLAKNNLMSKAGQDTLDAAAKKDFVPGWAEVSQFLTPEDRAQASKSVQRNVVDLVNKFNPDWVSDAAKAGSAAKGWYARATGLIQHMFGDEAHRFTNFVASLSPQKDVEQNFTDALNFYNMWQDAGKPLGPENEKVIRDLTERAEVVTSGQVARNQLYENLVNEVQPTGPKVSNFARNLKGNMDAVTKDRWMAYLFGNNERMFRWFKEGSPKPAVHLAADALIRAVGQSIGMLPAEVQETSWSFLRTVVNLTEKEKISPKEAIGRVNGQLIKEGASELTRLIADSPKVQSALNRLATATGDERFRADTLQNSPRFKQLLQEHADQPDTGGTINRAGAERGVKQAIKARSEISQAKKAKEAAPAEPKPAPKKAPKDKATEFNPADMSNNIRPTLSEKMKNSLA